MSCQSQAGALNCELFFGGTFDPVHFGHLAIIQSLREFAPGATIRLVPCAIPPLKSAPKTQFEHRLAMLKLVTEPIPEITIDCRESERERPSYTVDTLQDIASEAGDKCFVLILGLDSLLDLQRWYQWQRLSQMCHLLVINRPGNDFSQAQKQVTDSGFNLVRSYEELTKTLHGNGLLLKMADKPHSSTEIRDAINNNLPLDSLLPQSVIEYIRKNHLYKSENI